MPDQINILETWCQLDKPELLGADKDRSSGAELKSVSADQYFMAREPDRQIISPYPKGADDQCKGDCGSKNPNCTELRWNGDRPWAIEFWIAGFRSNHLRTGPTSGKKKKRCPPAYDPGSASGSGSGNLSVSREEALNTGFRVVFEVVCRFNDMRWKVHQHLRGFSWESRYTRKILGPRKIKTVSG